MTEELNTPQEEPSSAAYLALGIAVGAVIGVLCAPKSGAELRADMKDGFSKATNRDQEKAGTIVEAAEAVISEKTAKVVQVVEPEIAKAKSVGEE
jgi:gas vesicle protein